MFLAAAQTTGFKVFAVLVKGLLLIKEIHLIFCTLIRYSPRGRYLLVNEKKQILVYDTIEYRLRFCFRRHSGLIRNFKFVESTRQVLSLSDAKDLFLWRVVDRGYTPNSEETEITGHTPTEHYEDYDYCSRLDLFVAVTKSKSFVLFGKKCSIFLAQFLSRGYSVNCLRIDRESEMILAGGSTGHIMLFSLIHVMELVLQRAQSEGLENHGTIGLVTELCSKLGFFENADQHHFGRNVKDEDGSLIHEKLVIFLYKSNNYLSRYI